MTDHIGDGNQMVPDLDALEKLADEATRAEIDRLQTALSLAEDDKLVMAHELKEARKAIKPLADCEIIEPDVPLPDTDIARYPFTMGEIRAARAFLSKELVAVQITAETQEAKARRLFDEMARNIGREAVNHLKTMYPHMLSDQARTSKIWETSMVNTVRNDINWRMRPLLMAMIAMHQQWEAESPPPHQRAE